MTKEKNIGNLIIQEVSRILTSHLNSSGISYVNKPSCSEHCIEPAMWFWLLFKNRYNGIDALRKDYNGKYWQLLSILKLLGKPRIVFQRYNPITLMSAMQNHRSLFNFSHVIKPDKLRGVVSKDKSKDNFHTEFTSFERCGTCICENQII